jgi:hypothetical protein
LRKAILTNWGMSYRSSRVGRRLRRRWPDEVVALAPSSLGHEHAELLFPVVVVGAVGEAEFPAVTQELLKLGGHATTKILWPRLLLRLSETLVLVILPRYAVPCPWEPTRRHHVDEHERSGLNVVPPGRYAAFAMDIDGREPVVADEVAWFPVVLDMAGGMWVDVSLAEAEVDHIDDILVRRETDDSVAELDVSKIYLF